MLANWAQPRPEVGASREGEGSAMAVDEGPAAAAPGPSSEEATEESSAGGSVGRHRMTVAEGEAMDLDETENKVPEARGSVCHSAKPTEAEPAPKKLKAKSMFDYFKKK